jgi:hypothetical protein
MFHAIIKSLKSMKAVLVHNVPLIPAKQYQNQKKKNLPPTCCVYDLKTDCAVIQIYYKIHFESNNIEAIDRSQVKISIFHRQVDHHQFDGGFIVMNRK